MKLRKYIKPAVSVVALVVAALPAIACGSFYPIVPTPEYFYKKPAEVTSDGLQKRNENIMLWQKLTSDKIPAADVEQAVYRDSPDRLYDNFYSNKTANGFYTFLRNTNDQEVVDFLYLAKQIEKSWREISSPWYYPQSRNGADDGFKHFDYLIENCKAYKGQRLRDRYALQVARAYFATKRYAECAAYVDSAFADIADSNLFKRMAQNYAAGCKTRLGRTQEADSLFAVSGDIWSISDADPLGYMLARNPDAPSVMEYLRVNARDTAMMRHAAPLAGRLLDKKAVAYPGDWHLFMAYYDNEFGNDAKSARKHIYAAMDSRFSNDELADLAHAYKMKLDAKKGDLDPQRLITDLEWIESKTDVFNPDANEWKRRCRNIIYVDWVPLLWNRGDYATALLLCSYADNLDTSTSRQFRWGDAVYSDLYSDVRYDTRLKNDRDYGCLSFRLMNSLPSDKLAKAYDNMQRDTPLYKFLGRKARTDSDYYNDVIGTVALREGDYAKASEYLAKVSNGYEQITNVGKGGYLNRDPFDPYPRYKSTYGEYCANPSKSINFGAKIGVEDARPNHKLNFALIMNAYADKMKTAADADVRAMCALMYAIGRNNSFTDCWALTRYWDGLTLSLFVPVLDYWDDKYAADCYKFLYDFGSEADYDRVEAEYQKQVKDAMAMFATDEGRASGEYVFGNVRTIVKRYGNTDVARYIKTTCDNWRQWI